MAADYEFDFATPAHKPARDFTFLDLDSKLIERSDSFLDDDWNPEVSGTRFGDYQVTGPLGAGAMSRVLKGRHVKTKVRVAIKVLHKRLGGHAKVRERFRREAVAIARVKHPYIIDSFAYGIAHGHPFIVLERLDGGSVKGLLDRLRKKRELLTVARAVEVTAMTLSGLAAAHEAGLLHRDIKPDNLLLDRSGRVKLADFGLVKLVGSTTSGEASLTMTGAMLGTPRYMAPEQCLYSKDVDARADLYGIGVTLFELLTNRLPFTSGHTPIAQHAEQKAGPAPHVRTLRKDVPRTLDYFVARLLEFDPKRRYATAKETLAELHKAVPAPKRIALQITQDDAELHRGELKTGGKLVMGRAKDAAVTVSGEGLSRFHCHLEMTKKGLVVVDLDSTNGTWVGGRKISRPTLLPRRDTIRLGRNKVLIRWGESKRRKR